MEIYGTPVHDDLETSKVNKFEDCLLNDNNMFKEDFELIQMDQPTKPADLLQTSRQGLCTNEGDNKREDDGTYSMPSANTIWFEKGTEETCIKQFKRFLRLKKTTTPTISKDFVLCDTKSDFVIDEEGMMRTCSSNNSHFNRFLIMKRMNRSNIDNSLSPSFPGGDSSVFKKELEAKSAKDKLVKRLRLRKKEKKFEWKDRSRKKPFDCSTNDEILSRFRTCDGDEMSSERISKLSLKRLLKLNRSNKHEKEILSNHCDDNNSSEKTISASDDGHSAGYSSSDVSQNNLKEMTIGLPSKNEEQDAESSRWNSVSSRRARAKKEKSSEKQYDLDSQNNSRYSISTGIRSEAILNDLRRKSTRDVLHKVLTSSKVDTVTPEILGPIKQENSMKAENLTIQTPKPNIHELKQSTNERYSNTNNPKAKIDKSKHDNETTESNHKFQGSKVLLKTTKSKSQNKKYVNDKQFVRNSSGTECKKGNDSRNKIIKPSSALKPVIFQWNQDDFEVEMIAVRNDIIFQPAEIRGDCVKSKSVDVELDALSSSLIQDFEPGCHCFDSVAMRGSPLRSSAPYDFFTRSDDSDDSPFDGISVEEKNGGAGLYKGAPQISRGVPILGRASYVRNSCGYENSPFYRGVCIVERNEGNQDAPIEQNNNSVRKRYSAAKSLEHTRTQMRNRGICRMGHSKHILDESVCGNGLDDVSSYSEASKEPFFLGITEFVRPNSVITRSTESGDSSRGEIILSASGSMTSSIAGASSCTGSESSLSESSDSSGISVAEISACLSEEVSAGSLSTTSITVVSEE